ncbi:N4-gp56 family major capsid protein [Luteimonas saliphila]|uniref:N4-gp56 family major capsid protein n=1 Tax=Luteimonas saliphila TaxID=2804919 RepID=UPI00192D4B1A|nr:N4-gp56 family major capsid protein [Luteimonas saliphila]
MARTVFGVGDPSAVKRFSAMLFVDKARKSYWDNRFAKKGRDAEVPIQILTELESDAGDTISFDLFAQLRGRATYGDDRIKGKEEELKKFTDSLSIDQVRSSVSAGGRMTRKRVLHDLRMLCRRLSSDWWQRWNDEAINVYAAGARGINDDFIEDTEWAGFAGNPLQPPDANHQLYGGSATSKASMVNTDFVSLTLIDRLVAKAKTMGGGSKRQPKIRPIMIDGENRYVYLMSPADEFRLRGGTSVGQWLDIQKAAAAANGKNNPIFKGGLGMYNNVILHEHQGVIRFDDYGVGVNLPAARNLFIGMQAMVQAFGSPGNGLRMEWNEETDDRGNEIVITTGCISGVKATVFNNERYGSIAADVYSPEVE